MKKALSPNTRARSEALATAAAEIIQAAGGIEQLDRIPKHQRPLKLQKLYHQMVDQTGCHWTTAKNHIAKSLRRQRHPDETPANTWGGSRGGGRPRKERHMALTLTIKVTPDCEGLLHSLPRGHEYELTDEDYNEDGSGIVKIDIHDLDELTGAIEQTLNTNDDVISYHTTL
ncbi:MAG: hypothetical protein ACYTEQ_09490 [Planctomycetota bacterium]|jgi:hypothetical protein